MMWEMELKAWLVQAGLSVSAMKSGHSFPVTFFHLLDAACPATTK